MRDDNEPPHPQFGLRGAIIGAVVGALLLPAVAIAAGAPFVAVLAICLPFGIAVGATIGEALGEGVHYSWGMFHETFRRRNYWPLIVGIIGTAFTLVALQLGGEVLDGAAAVLSLFMFVLFSCFCLAAQEVARRVRQYRHRVRGLGKEAKKVEPTVSSDNEHRTIGGG